MKELVSVKILDTELELFTDENQDRINDIIEIIETELESTKQNNPYTNSYKALLLICMNYIGDNIELKKSLETLENEHEETVQIANQVSHLESISEYAEKLKNQNEKLEHELVSIKKELTNKNKLISQYKGKMNTSKKELESSKETIEKLQNQLFENQIENVKKNRNSIFEE
jgi:cell division protein ZapA (FtsZ GTPase activity inhibitor)